MAVLALGAPAWGQNAVSLRVSATVAAGEGVRLSDIAAVLGPEADRLGAIEIPAAALGRGREIAVEDLRRVLSEAGVNWSTTTLRGGVCTVRVVQGGEAAARKETGVRGARGVPVEGGLREALSLRIAQILRAEPGDVRLAFAESDAEFLGLAVSGRVVEARVVGASERMALAVTVFEEGRIIASRTIRVGVQVRRAVVLAAGAKRRGDVLAEGDLTRDVQWISPGVAAAGAERAVGAAVRSRLNAGEIITEADLTPAVVVNKGEQVVVRALAGGVSVMTRGRALGAARDGELVQLAALDDPKRVITARMEGRGRAVLVATPAKEQGR
jgi:flagella basal body P-ring formation protein FlgA